MTELITNFYSLRPWWLAALVPTVMIVRFIARQQNNRLIVL